ncbi:MAG: type II toxin-antitoxin system VapC family toxin [Janthinobacterium lividum]
MGLLLDSHVFLWFLEADPRLGDGATRLIERRKHVYLSAASVWEFSIKAASGKLPLLKFSALAVEKGLIPLPILAAHGEAVAHLPRLHRDPFDHMLLAQAKVEGFTLVTHDRILADYGVPVLLV